MVNNRVEPVVDQLLGAASPSSIHEALHRVLPEPLAGLASRSTTTTTTIATTKATTTPTPPPLKKGAADVPRNVLPLCHPATHVWKDGDLKVG